MPSRAPLNEFELVIPSATSAAAGTTVTPGNNTYGSYTQLLSGAQVTDDAFGIWINLNAVAVSGVARDCIAKLGVDPAGGTSYADLAVDLLVSCAGAISGAAGGGIWYYFPLRIAAASSVAVALSVNNATVGTGSAFCRLLCKPTHPELVRTGTFVRTFGSTPASSSGTAVTPNSGGGKSSYVQLGSAVADQLWFWGLGIGCNNAAMNNNAAAWDLAIGSSTTVNRSVVVDQVAICGTSETLQYVSAGAFGIANPGDLVFARAGGSGASPSGMSAAAYGVGG